MGYSGNSICFSVRKTRTQILGLQIIYPVSLGKLFDHFDTQLTPLENEWDSIYLPGL